MKSKSRNKSLNGNSDRKSGKSSGKPFGEPSRKPFNKESGKGNAFGKSAERTGYQGGQGGSSQRGNSLRNEAPRSDRYSQKDSTRGKYSPRSSKYSPITIVDDKKDRSASFSARGAAAEFQPDKPSSDAESLILEGRKAVLEALNHEKPVDRVLIRKDSDKPVEGTLRVIAAKAKERGLVVREVTRAKLDELSETGHHQGVVALCPAVGYVEISEILEIAKQKGEQPFVIVLDGVTDPHNLGAVIRTAEAGGAHGVIVPKRRAVGLTGTVAKTSAGAIEHMPVARVTNIVQALRELKKAGLWIACADMNGQSMYEAGLEGPVALVLGAEGEGVSRLVAENSDYAVSIPMFGKIASLNVSVAAGVLVYEVVRRRSR